MLKHLLWEGSYWEKGYYEGSSTEEPVGSECNNSYNGGKKISFWFNIQSLAVANKDVWGIAEEQRRHIVSNISFSSDIAFFSDTHFLQAYVPWCIFV